MVQKDIRSALERFVSILENRPDARFQTTHTQAAVANGLACRVTEDDHTAIADMSSAIGGTDTGPTPGFFARVAVSSCIAIGIKMMAEQSGIAIETVKVSVEMDFDNGAMFGVGDASAAPLNTRVDIRLSSNAEHAELDELVQPALTADPYFLALRDPQNVTTNLQIE